MNLKTKEQHKKTSELPFPKPQGGPATEAASIDRRERVVKAVRDFYRRSGK